MDEPFPFPLYRQVYPLSYADADASGLLRVTALLNYLQITAGDHSESRGFDYLENRALGVFWVLGRLTARFDSWPVWPCRFVVETWSRSTRGVFAFRDFRFGPEGSDWSGRASTAWVLLKDRRPQRPDAWVTAFHQGRAEPPLAEMPAALPAFAVEGVEPRAETLLRRTHSVYADWDDVDMNGHVNNVSAVGWCLAQHEFGFLAQWRPSFLEANFLAEMFCDEKFQILLEPSRETEDERTFDYLVVRDSDQTPCLRLRVTFRQS